jgi:hypothetical protein
MSITCQICQQKFAKIIPWQHLKTHEITSAEYKKQHGSVYSAETLAKLQQRTPHNKGKKITDPELLARIRSAIEKREQRFRRGEISRGAPKTDDQKRVLSEKSKIYAAKNPNEMRSRAQKAIDTKKKNGYDFGGNMRGKKHQDSTKKIIGEKSRLINQEKSQQANDRILSRITELDLVLRNDIREWSLDLTCDRCLTDFSFTKQYFHLSKITHTICPTCHPRSQSRSGQELELYAFIKNLRPDAVSGYRSHYHSKEIDIYIPDLKVGFEYNGLYWHSESVLLHNDRSPRADHEKLLAFQSQGIRLIQIFEDEWINQPHIVKSRIANILGKTTKKISARSCDVKKVSSRDAARFCDDNHIMGSGRSNVRLGLYHDHELVSVMTFSKSNISRKVAGWELNRFASRIDLSVTGGASRLFTAFLRSYDPDRVVSFSDNRWSDGELYQKLGFQKINAGSPNYWYTMPNTTKRIHRFNLRKTSTEAGDQTEIELRRQQGYDRIWDSGSSRWEWLKENGA